MVDLKVELENKKKELDTLVEKAGSSRFGSIYEEL